ncbi:MAG: lppF [Bacteroidetes bacterium]|nr:lppF [Bacteroidota bacterium]
MTNQFLSQLDSFLTTHASRSPDSPPVAVFDCDGTIIQADVGEAMFYFQLEHFLFRVSPASLWPDFPKQDELNNLYESIVALPQEKRTQDRRFPSFAEMMIDWYFDQLAEGATEKACSDIVRLWAGFSRTEIHQVASATLTQELASPVSQRTIGRATLPKGIRYIQQVVDLFRRLQRRGFDLWAVSGSNQWSVEAVFQRLGLPADHAIGIDLLEFDGELTSQVRAPVPVLGGKVLALQHRITKQPLIVVSDSTYDIPLFEFSAGLKILVKPQDANNDDFFRKGNIRKDTSWLVIERPTLLDSLS